MTLFSESFVCMDKGQNSLHISNPEDISYGRIESTSGDIFSTWFNSRISSAVMPRNGICKSLGTFSSYLSGVCVIGSDYVYDIYLHDNERNDKELKLYGWQYHTPCGMEWLVEHNREYYKHVRHHISNLYGLCKVPDALVSKTSFILNTRWSATNYYHWMNEALPRLLLLKEIGMLHSVLLVWIGNSPYKPYHLQSFEALGIDTCSIAVCSPPLLINSLFWISFYSAGSITSKQNLSISRAFLSSLHSSSLPGSIVISRRLLYITRRNLSYRYLVNETEVCEYLVARGFSVVCLEDLLVVDQIQLFQDARAIIAVHGAGLTNVLFANDCALIEIMPSSINPLYYMLHTSTHSIDNTLANNKYACLPLKDLSSAQAMFLPLNLLEDYLDLFCI